MIDVSYATSVTWRMVPVSFKKNLAYGKQWCCLTSVEKCCSLSHPIIWRGKKRFGGEIKECLHALFSYIVAYIEYVGRNMKNCRIPVLSREYQYTVNYTIEEDEEKCIWRTWRISGNLKCVKENCSLRKQVGEEESLGPAGGKRLWFQQLWD